MEEIKALSLFEKYGDRGAILSFGIALICMFITFSSPLTFCNPITALLSALPVIVNLTYCKMYGLNQIEDYFSFGYCIIFVVAAAAGIISTIFF